MGVFKHSVKYNYLFGFSLTLRVLANLGIFPGMFLRISMEDGAKHRQNSRIDG